MTREELIPGRLYKPKGYRHWYYVFLSCHIGGGIQTYAFDNKQICCYGDKVGKTHVITNGEFWRDVDEVSFDEVKEWMPEEFMPKIANYEIY